MEESDRKSSHRGAANGADDWEDFGTAEYDKFAPTYLSEDEWRTKNKTDEMQFNGEY